MKKILITYKFVHRKHFYKPDQDCAYDSDEYELIGNDEFDDIIESPSESPIPINEDAVNNDSDDSFDPEAESDSEFEQDDDEEDDTNHNVCAAGPSTENANALDGLMDADEEDEVLQRIVAETKRERDHPPDIKTEDFIFDLCFHPHEDLLAVGTFTGLYLLCSNNSLGMIYVTCSVIMPRNWS